MWHEARNMGVPIEIQTHKQCFLKPFSLTFTPFISLAYLETAVVFTVVELLFTKFIFDVAQGQVYMGT